MLSSAIQAVCSSVMGCGSTSICVSVDIGSSVIGIATRGCSVGKRFGRTRASQRKSEEVCKELSPQLLSSGCGKREAHINWSMSTCKMAAPASAIQAVCSSVMGCGSTSICVSVDIGSSVTGIATRGCSVGKRFGRTRASQRKSEEVCKELPPQLLSSGCGKREAHINWSMATCKMAAPVTGTTLRTNGPVPEDSRQ